MCEYIWWNYDLWVQDKNSETWGQGSHFVLYIHNIYLFIYLFIYYPKHFVSSTLI
jgi:hypothetical protein